MSIGSSRLVATVLVLALAAPVGLAGEQVPAAAASESDGRAGSGSEPNQAPLAVSLGRVRRGLQRSQPLRTAIARTPVPTFRVTVEQRLPPIERWLGDPRDLAGGPPVGSPTHAELLRLTTPPLAQPYAAFTGGELLSVATTSLLSALAVKASAGAVGEWLRSRDERKAREQVIADLEELNRLRVALGLPPVPVPVR